MTEVIPLAYKFRVKKDGMIYELIVLKDADLEYAKKNIEEFFNNFKILNIRKKKFHKLNQKLILGEKNYLHYLHLEID